MRFSLPKKWRYLGWAGVVMALLGLPLGYIGFVLSGGNEGILLAGGARTVGGFLPVVICNCKLRCPSCGWAPSLRILGKADTFFCPQCGARINLE